MFWIDYLSRVVHIATAIALIGGSVFTLFVLMPATKLLSEEMRAAFAAAVCSRWKRFVHVGVLLFLLSGFYNYFRAMPLHKGDGLYHALVGTKILIALAVFVVAAALVGRSTKFESFRRNRRNWLWILVLLATVIVCISSFLKVRGAGANELPAIDARSLLPATGELLANHRIQTGHVSSGT